LNLQKYERLKIEYKNEKINRTGISTEAKLKVEISSINVITKMALPKNSKNIMIKLRLGDLSKTTNSRHINDLNFNENFEFLIDSIENPLNIEIFNDNSAISLGEATIPLQQITNQEDNEVSLEVNDHVTNKILFVINLKISLLLSYYKLYQDKFIICEAECAKLSASIEKLSSVLDNLSGKYILNMIEPFKYLLNINNNVSEAALGSSTYITNNGKIKGNYEDYEKKIANQFENIVNSTLSIIFYLFLRYKKRSMAWYN
jgi:hypothetical protein